MWGSEGCPSLSLLPSPHSNANANEATMTTTAATFDRFFRLLRSFRRCPDGIVRVFSSATQHFAYKSFFFLKHCNPVKEFACQGSKGLLWFSHVENEEKNLRWFWPAACETEVDSISVPWQCQLGLWFIKSFALATVSTAALTDC